MDKDNMLVLNSHSSRLQLSEQLFHTMGKLAFGLGKLRDLIFFCTAENKLTLVSPLEGSGQRKAGMRWRI